MDGRNPTLRNLFIAALALAGPSTGLRADDFIRQPTMARTHAQSQSGAEPNATAAEHRAAQTKASTVSASESIVNVPRGAVPRDEKAPRVEAAVAASLEPGPGWQAIGEELRAHVDNCERLLSRGAFLSAMEESRRGIVRLARVLDLRQNKLTSEPAWAQAQQALREAREFTTHQRIATDVELFSRIIRSHETPALHEADVTELTPLAAAQHYRAYAEKCLVEASQGHPWFSELYYCLGRSLESQAAAGDPQADALLQEALTYYRSAHTIQPSNPTNTNQLAFVLLRLDRPSEALVQLAEAVRNPNCPLEAWQNLIEASSRVQDGRTEQWAMQNYMALKQRGAAPSGQTGTLVELDPKQFAAMSPYTSGPPVQPQTAPTQSQPNAPSSTPRTATAPSGGLFR